MVGITLLIVTMGYTYLLLVLSLLVIATKAYNHDGLLQTDIKTIDGNR